MVPKQYPSFWLSIDAYCSSSCWSGDIQRPKPNKNTIGGSVVLPTHGQTAKRSSDGGLGNIALLGDAISGIDISFRSVSEKVQ
jgi:hypothetical protein